MSPAVCLFLDGQGGLGLLQHRRWLVLVCRVGTFELRDPADMVALCAGPFSMALFLARHSGVSTAGITVTGATMKVVALVSRCAAVGAPRYEAYAGHGTPDPTALDVSFVRERHWDGQQNSLRGRGRIR